MTYDEIGSGGVIAGGTATSTMISENTVSGGVTVGGFSNNTFSDIAAGGMTVGGTATSTIIAQNRASGGVTVGGAAYFSTISDRTGTGNCVASGNTQFFVIKTASTSGGVVVGGHTIIIDQPYIGGGIVVSGTSTVLRRSNLQGSGGVVCAGSGRQNFFDYETASGGVRTTLGHGKVEKIKYRVPSEPRTGIGRAIEGCVLAEVPTPESELLKPKYWMEQEALKTNPREQLTGVWCQVEDACEEGVLPRVIQKRLKGHIPNPKGTISPRDRGIATATGV